MWYGLSVTLLGTAMRHLLFLSGFALIALSSPLAGSDLTPTVSVGLFSGQRVIACTITSQGPLTLHDERGDRLASFPAAAKLEAETEAGVVVISCAQPRGGGRSAAYVISAPAPIQVALDGRSPRAYRGSIAISARSERLMLINRVGLEDYLRGVLASEIPASFAPEALRAQAMAARTYALSAVGRHRAEGYDLCDAPHCQVYTGVSREDARTDAAVRDTAGLIITYQGKPIHAVYHDCCGGRTAGNETAWSGSQPLPYLRPVPDVEGGAALCVHSPRAVWTRQIPQLSLASALAQFGVRAPISAIEAGPRDENGRPKEFRISGPQGEVTILAGALRAAANSALGWNTLPSADFTAAPNGDSIVFAGRGSGHGVGLCQWGANAMAKAGRTAAEILAHYYAGTRVEPMSDEVAHRLGRPTTG